MAELGEGGVIQTERPAPQVVEHVVESVALAAPTTSTKAGGASAGVSAGGLRRAVVQAKLSVGPANDPYENEADAVAARVVRSLRAQRSTDVPTETRPVASRIQRAATTGDIGVNGGDVDASTERIMRSEKSKGAALPADSRSKMEGAFGADFGNIRVHAGAQAADLNNRIQAKAFTTGNNIFFRDGLPDTNTSDGQNLLAHELTHTIQQGGGKIRRAPGPQQQKQDMSNRVRGNGSNSMSDENLENLAEVDQAQNDAAMEQTRAEYLADQASGAGQLGSKAAKVEFANHLQTILKYADEIDATVALLKQKQVSAKNFNRAFASMSAAQLACGLAATALGVTLIVITAGVAAPAVAAAAGAIGSAALGTGIAGGVVGVGAEISKGGRHQAMGVKNESLASHVMNADSQTKAGAAGVSKVGAVKGGIEGTKAGVAAGGASTTAAATVGASIGAAGGVVTAGLAAKNLGDAYNFDSKTLYQSTGDDWQAIESDLQNFRITLGMSKNTELNAEFCKIVREKLKASEKAVGSLHNL
jgi:hypothetical protein